MSSHPRGLLGGLRRLFGGQLDSAPPAGARPSASYMRGGRNVTFAGWRPALRETQHDISEAWDSASARAVDLIQNSGWISGMVDQAVANTVGTGLRLFPKPENSLFGMSDKAARDWSKMVSSRWEAYARSPQECDIEGLRTHGKLQAAAFRSWLGTGEIFAELPWRRRPWNKYGSKIRLLPPHRLSRKSDTMRRLVNGVFLDRDGMPTGYLVTKKSDVLGTVDVEVRARDNMGRERIVLAYDGLPGTYRGICPLTPALQVARQFDQLSDATLMKSIVQQLFAATIEGEAPTDEMLQGILTPAEYAKSLNSQDGGSPFLDYLDMQAVYYDAATLDVGINGRLTHLFPGQELKLHTAQIPGSEYEAYSSHLLREICRCFGMTYTSGTGDFKGATYNSERSANTGIYEVTTMRRDNVVAPFCQATYEAWLEEEIFDHGLPFPGGYEGFMSNRVAACRADWRGSPRPEADPLKAAKAHEIWKRLGVMSDEMIASDLGVDIEDVYAARAGEADLRKLYKLPDDQLMGPNGGAPVAPGGGEEDEEGETE